MRHLCNPIRVEAADHTPSVACFDHGDVSAHPGATLQERAWSTCGQWMDRMRGMEGAERRSPVDHIEMMAAQMS
jgi:hypothetical protein